jgi:hypothetical protein
MAKPAPITRFSRFTKATDDTRFRIIANSVGEVGTGKTHFWLGAPAPIVILTFDLGLEGVVEPFATTKDIYVASYDLGLLPSEADDAPTQFTQDQAIEMRDKVILDFEDAIRQGARTVIIDRESDFWGHCSYAEFGDPKTGMPKDWDALKNVERRMIAMAKASDINLGIIQGMRNEWVSQVNKKTGTKGITQSGLRVAAGHDEIDALMFTNLFHTRVKNPVTGEPEFVIRVGKSRGVGAPAVQEQEFTNLTFSEFAQLVHPASTPEDWE